MAEAVHADGITVDQVNTPSLVLQYMIDYERTPNSRSLHGNQTRKNLSAESRQTLPKSPKQSRHMDQIEANPQRLIPNARISEHEIKGINYNYKTARCRCD